MGSADVPTIPSRESAATKARRYLVEGRLILSRVVPGEVEGTCRGDGMVFHLGYSRGGWWCDCPARSTCAHLLAARLVVAVDL